MLSVIMLSVIMLNIIHYLMVIMLYVVFQSIVMLSVVMLSIIIFNGLILSIIMEGVYMLNVFYTNSALLNWKALSRVSLGVKFFVSAKHFSLFCINMNSNSLYHKNKMVVYDNRKGRYKLKHHSRINNYTLIVMN